MAKLHTVKIFSDGRLDVFRAFATPEDADAFARGLNAYGVAPRAERWHTLDGWAEFRRAAEFILRPFPCKTEFERPVRGSPAWRMGRQDIARFIHPTPSEN